MFFAYSTLVYPGNLGYDCNTLLFLVWCFSAMFVAAPATAKVGSKAAILIGLVLYCLQYICFVTCSLLPDGWILRLVAYTGAVGAGLGAGFVWTAEGVFFAESTQRVVDVTGDSFELKSAQLAAIFGTCGLGLECAVKIATYALEALGFSITIVFSIALVLALGSALLFNVCVRPVHVGREKRKRTSRCEVALGATSLWLDPRIWLIMFLTLDFSVGSAFINGIVAKDYVGPQLGSEYVALLSASVALVGAVAQAPLKFMAVRFGKGVVMAIGAAALIASPALFVTAGVDRMGWWLAAFYVLHGIVRGIFQGTNVAVYADHFPEPKTEPAFANMCMQQGIAASLAFFFAARVAHNILMLVMVALAVCIVPGYWVARSLRPDGVATSMTATPGSERSAPSVAASQETV
jgi:MFS family permease